MKSECRAMQSLRVFGLTAHLTDKETEASRTKATHGRWQNMSVP